MVSPAHIQEAEIYGMPDCEPESEECPQCNIAVDEVLKCLRCGLRCCENCRTYLEKYLESFCSPECAIQWLLEEMERIEDEADKYWQLKAAAKKAATTGNHADLHEYLELRRKLL